MKILYVTTIGGTMRFFPTLIQSLLEEGHTVDIATNEATSPVPPIYRELGCRIFSISCSRSPLSKGNLTAIKQLQRLVTDNQYDIVHCHTPIAAMCTRLACRKVRKKGTKVYYTAHGFHFYSGAPIKNWLLFYPVEKLCARMTDVLITMNLEDYARAQKKLRAKRIVYVPGVGIDLSRLDAITVDETVKRKEIGVPNDATLLLSVGELNDNKNHALVLRAVAELEDPNIHYVIAGKGSRMEMLNELAGQLGLSERLHLLGHRSDVGELCKIADLFCFPSFREGLPVSIMEAMACGAPIVCSRIRGNTDLVDEHGGYLFDPSLVNECRDAIKEMLSKDMSQMGAYNAEKIRSFDISVVVCQMKDLYEKQ